MAARARFPFAGAFCDAEAVFGFAFFLGGFTAATVVSSPVIAFVVWSSSVITTSISLPCASFTSLFSAGAFFLPLFFAAVNKLASLVLRVGALAFVTLV